MMTFDADDELSDEAVERNGNRQNRWCSVVAVESGRQDGGEVGMM